MYATPPPPNDARHCTVPGELPATQEIPVAVETLAIEVFSELEVTGVHVCPFDDDRMVALALPEDATTPIAEHCVVDVHEIDTRLLT